MPLEHPIKLPEPDKLQLNNWLYRVWEWVTRRVAVAGSYGGTGQSALITVNADGIITAVSQVAVSAAPDLFAASTWQDLSASRAKNTVYQNTLSKSIVVNISIAVSSPVDSVLCELKAGTTSTPSVIVGQVRDTNGSVNRNATVSAVIPPSHYYTLSEGTALAFTFVWAELR